MKSISIFPLRFSGTVLCLLTLNFAALATPQETDPSSVLWPDAARPKLKIRDYYTTFDGAYVPIVSLENQEYSFEIFKRPGLSVRTSPSSRFSAVFSFAEAEDVTLALSTFEANEFLEDLSDETWQAYKLGLVQSRRANELVYESSNIESPATPYVFGLPFRQVSYLASPSGKVMQVREIFALENQRLIVFTVLGTPQSIVSNWEQVDQLISEFSLK